jgi:hypothetical protein
MPEDAPLKINTPHFAAKKVINITEKDQPNRQTDEKLRRREHDAVSANTGPVPSNKSQNEHH